MMQENGDVKNSCLFLIKVKKRSRVWARPQNQTTITIVWGGSRRNNKRNSTITVTITKIFAYALQRKNNYSSSRSLTTGLSTSVLSLFLKEYTEYIFSNGHKAQEIWGKGEGAKSGLSYAALVSHTRNLKSSFNRFYLIILYNKFIHPPTTQQSPKSLIHSMKTLLKPPMKWHIYNGWKMMSNWRKKH